MFQADEEETIYVLLIAAFTFNQGIFVKDVLWDKLNDYGAQSKIK